MAIRRVMDCLPFAIRPEGVQLDIFPEDDGWRIRASHPSRQTAGNSFISGKDLRIRRMSGDLVGLVVDHVRVAISMLGLDRPKFRISTRRARSHAR